MYAMHDLLIKMGAPEVRERNRMEWHYFDREKTDLAGFAVVRMEAGGKRLVAELSRTCENYEDDHGNIHDRFNQTFYMMAERTGGGYVVRQLMFDGDAYNDPARDVVELGVSIFHARALDISIAMVEHSFNTHDIVNEVDEEPVPQFQKAAMPVMHSAEIIPFPYRRAVEL